MNCSNCGFENPDGMKFCGGCGSALQNLCPQCDFENPPQFRFCGECGASLTGEVATPSSTQEEPPAQVESPPTEPHTPEAERRQLTILFTDLIDSTRLSGQLDAEDYREIVRAYQITCAEVIERFDCHLAQTLGDGLLIYSGYPVAHENDAERAVRVGLGILDAMRDLNSSLKQDKDIQLGVRVGIHTGPVVVGEVGAGARQEQLALGEVPNVAARIQGLAEPDTMVISEVTHRLIQGYFDCEPLGEQALRGVEQPIAVHRVLSESGVQSRLDIVSTHGLTPLVGREQESGLLLERWSQVKDGQGQAVLLSGEAGIGKSRLVQALKEHVSDEPHAQEECRCSPYHTNSAFFPLAELLQRKLGWQPEDDSDEKLHKLETVLTQTHLDVEVAVPLFTALLSLPLPDDRYPLIQLSSQQQRQQTLEAFLQLVLLAVEQHPVVFIVEDLHWIDPSTLEFLELLIDQTPTASIFVLLTCRPEFQPPWSHRSYLTEITVNRLSRHQIEQMATQVSGGKTLPSEVIEQLMERTDGVPLYVEEMTKVVLESGVMKDVDGQYELTGSISSLAIPSTLQDSLMARLDRLVTAKAIAQYASVIGRQFSYKLLQAVSQLDETMLQHELSRLAEAELVYQRGVLPGAIYIFKHALIQDTAYESLLRSTRQGYHRRIAEVLEERFSETAEMQPELLAHHYTEAGLNEQAVEYWHKAGQKSMQRSAYMEATSHLTQAITLLKNVPDTPHRVQQELTFQTTLGQALMMVKGWAAPEVERAYTRAQALSQQVEDIPQRFQVLAGLWRFYLTRAVYHTAHELAEQLLWLAESRHERSLLRVAHYTLGMTMLFQGVFVDASTHLEHGIDLYNPQQDGSNALLLGTDSQVSCLAYVSVVLWLLGYPAQALRRSHEALHLAQELSHLPTLSHVSILTAYLLECYREWHSVQERLETAMSIASEHGFALQLARQTMVYGRTLAMQGHGEEGIAQIHQGLLSASRAGAEQGRPQFLFRLAEAYSTMGQVEEGFVVLTEALDLVDQTGERWYEAEQHRLKGELLLQLSLDNQTEAESCFQEAITIAQKQSAKSWELRAATSLAKLWQSQGKREEAWQLLEPVYSWFTEGFDTADLKDAKALLDELMEGR